MLNLEHGLRTPGEEIAFTARPKIHSQILKYGRGIFCLPHRPKFSDFFDLCLHWVSVVRDLERSIIYFSSILIDPKVSFAFVEVEEKLSDAFNFIGSIL